MFKLLLILAATNQATRLLHTWNRMKCEEAWVEYSDKRLSGKQRPATDGVWRLSLKFSGYDSKRVRRAALENVEENSTRRLFSLNPRITLYRDMITRLSAKTRKCWAIHSESEFQSESLSVWMPRKQEWKKLYFRITTLESLPLKY